MFAIIINQRNANQNYGEISPHTMKSCRKRKKQQQQIVVSESTNKGVGQMGVNCENTVMDYTYGIWCSRNVERDPLYQEPLWMVWVSSQLLRTELGPRQEQ